MDMTPAKSIALKREGMSLVLYDIVTDLKAAKLRY